MKVTLLVVGKTDKKFLLDAILEYEKRISRYCRFEVRVVPDVKATRSTLPEVQKQKEAEAIMAAVGGQSDLCLLDEHGDILSSVDFAKLIERKMMSGPKELVFIVGGPFGFADELKAKVTTKISLSRMTFSHQLVRLLFVEQLYRAMTIIRGEPYHNP